MSICGSPFLLHSRLKQFEKKHCIHSKIIHNPVWIYYVNGESPHKLETPEIGTNCNVTDLLTTWDAQVGKFEYRLFGEVFCSVERYNCCK